MDSKEGIAQVAPVDARAAGLLDPSLLWSGADDAAMADPPREQAGDRVRSPTSPGENPRRESCCLYIQVLRDSDVVLEQDRKVPDYCWNAIICKDICEAQTRVLPGTFSVDLSDTEFLVYKLPKTGQGMSETELALFADLIGGSYLWAGVPADVFVTPRTTQQARRDKAKTCEYRCRIMLEGLAATQAQLQDLDLAACKQRELRENLVGHGRGMIQRVDKYLAQQHGKEPPQAPGPVSAPPVFPDRTATLDDYLSAWEPSEFEYDSEETDPGEPEDDPEEDDVSVSSDSKYKSNGHDTDRTHRTNISNHNHRFNQRKWRSTGSDIPQMLRRRKIGVKARWSCLCSENSRRRAP